jgi:DNA-binding transcriptional LysR family regulator
MMDLWQLNVFCNVVKQRSFSKAGRVVHLSQPTVSSHIKDLEDHFGTRLVDRLARHAVPTKAGELLYSYANQLLALRDETEAAMADFLGNVKGRLTVGGSTIPGGYLLPRIIGLFATTYPKVQMTLRVADTSEIMDDIIAGHVEMGVVGALAENAQLEQVALISDELKLIVPADHKWASRKRIPIKLLVGEPMIIREPGSGTLRAFSEHLERKGYDINALNIVAEMGSTEAVRQGIKGKIGISILSEIAVADDIRSGQLNALSVEGLTLKRSFYLTTHKQRTLSPLCRTFIDFLTRELKASS